jgi:hypothetical protein
MLAANSGDTVSVICGVALIVLGVFTVALIIGGRDPAWTQTRRAREDAKKRARSR